MERIRDKSCGVTGTRKKSRMNEMNTFFAVLILVGMLILLAFFGQQDK